MFRQINRNLSINSYKKVIIVLVVVVFITSLVLYQEGGSYLDYLRFNTTTTSNTTEDSGNRTIINNKNTNNTINSEKITEHSTNKTKNSSIINKSSKIDSSSSEVNPPPVFSCPKEIFNHAVEPFGSKLVVISSYHENLDWVCEIGKYKLPHIVYTRDNPNNKYNVVPNFGNEAAVYLKFIIDHYDRLPNNTAFVHGHRHSWHSGREIDDSLINLRWHDYPYLDINFHYWQTANTKNSKGDHHVIKEHWDALYKEYLGEMPNLLNFYCCAQFVVSRERIRLRPVKFYERLYEFLLQNKISSYFSSRLLEYTWSYIFGEPVDRREYTNPCHVLRC